MVLQVQHHPWVCSLNKGNRVSDPVSLLSFRSGNGSVKRIDLGLISDSGCKNDQSKETEYLETDKRILVKILSEFRVVFQKHDLVRNS